VIEDIDPDTLAVRMAAWKTVVLDVREISGRPTARIPEAILIPLRELKVSLVGLPLETRVSLVCETGEQSRVAAAILAELGYRNIAVLRGGLTGYVERGLPVVSQ
jgi:rhodanese-related sulfurtransferase